MPVRIEEVPNLGLDDGFRTAKMDPGAAAAPAKALGAVAEGIAGLGQPFHQIAQDVQTMENENVLSRKRSEMKKDFTDFQAGLVSDPDPASRLEKTREFLAGQEKKAEDPSLAPVLRGPVMDSFRQAGDSLFQQVRIQSALLAQDNLRQSVNHEYATAATEQELKVAHDSAVAGGLETAGTWPVRLNAFRAKKRDEELQGYATDHPAEFLDASARKPPEGVHPNRLKQLQQIANQALLKQTDELSRDIMGKIQSGSPDISSREQIDLLTPGMRPETRAQLYDFLDRVLSEKHATREYQDETVGKVATLLGTYGLSPEGALDTQYVAMAQLARTLPDSPVRDGLLKQIDEVRDGKIAQAKTFADAALPAFQQALEAQRFGAYQANPSPRLGRLIDDGLLRDAAKLQRAGLSAEEAFAIVTLDEPGLRHRLEAVMPQDSAASTAATLIWPKSDENRVKAFRLIHGQRVRKDPETGGASPLEKAAYSAVLDGTPREAFVAAAGDPETARIEADNVTARTRMGAAFTDFAAWARTRGQPSEQEVHDKVFELTGRYLRQQLAEKKIASPPSWADLKKQEDQAGR